MLTLVGMITQMIGTVMLGYYTGLRSSQITIGVFLVIIGLGEALIWSPMITSVLRFAKQEFRGVANGTAFMLVNIAFAGSIAIVTAVSASFLPSSVVSQIFLGNLSLLTHSQAMLFNDGISRAIIVLGLLNLVSLPFLIVVIKEQRKLHSSM